MSNYKQNNINSVEAINIAYSKLSIAEQNIIDRQCKNVRNEIQKRKGLERTMVSEAALVELIGKVGMWMVEHDK